MSDNDTTTTPGSDSPPPPPEPRLGERLGEHAERARELGQALARRLAQPPRGGHALRWAASWVAYAAFAAALVWLRLGSRPPLAGWVVLFVLAGEVTLPVEAGHRWRHIAWVGLLWLFGTVMLTTFYHDSGAVPMVALLALVAGALNPWPLTRAVWWAERLGVWGLVLWGWFVVFLLMASAGLAALHPVVAALDPPFRPLLDAVVSGAAFTVSAAAAAAVILGVLRLYARRVEGA